jgi:hypothetical protein
MTEISACSLPETALLNKYRDDHYTDCFSAEVAGNISHRQYVETFYTTWLFKAERFILKWAVSKPSTDEQATQLARGETDQFAAWTVEDRARHQILLNDFRGTTRSWLMVESTEQNASARTRLYFGSAVISTETNDDGSTGMGRSFRLLLGAHKLYSRALLRAAVRRLRKSCN